jgi:hypothetical protein
MRRVFVTLICFTLVSAAQANFVTGFESAEGYTGSASGTMLAGQQSWYTADPAPPSSSECLVYTYASSPYGLSANPQGGEQFVIGRSGEPTPAYGRAEHLFDWSTLDYARVTYDVSALYNGVEGGAADYLGSFSMQPSTTAAYWQSILTWAGDLTGKHYTHGYFALEYPSGGTPWIPGPEWQNLSVDHWYRFTTDFRISTQEILSASITDITTGTTTTVDLATPLHFILPTGSTATAFRLFAGGSIGDIVAWDNVNIIPEPATIILLLMGLAAARRR